MILQTSPGHKFVYQQTLIILGAISDEFHKIRMVKLTKKINFSLQFDDDADVSVGQFQLEAKSSGSRKKKCNVVLINYRPFKLEGTSLQRYNKKLRMITQHIKRSLTYPILLPVSASFHKVLRIS